MIILPNPNSCNVGLTWQRVTWGVKSRKLWISIAIACNKMHSNISLCTLTKLVPKSIVMTLGGKTCKNHPQMTTCHIIPANYFADSEGCPQNLKVSREPSYCRLFVWFFPCAQFPILENFSSLSHCP